MFTRTLRYSGAMQSARAWMGYAVALGSTLACTLAGLAMAGRFDLVNIAMVYLLAVVVVALQFSRGAAVATAVLCVAAFDYVFVPPQGAFTIDDAQYLLTFAIMLSVALVISWLTASRRRQEEAQAALALEAQTERIRSTLLASISHDLRTPLAVLAGASSTLAQSGERMEGAERKLLADSIYAQASRLSDQVAKVLQMTRLEAGALPLARDWVSIAEIAGSVLARQSARASGRHLITEIAPDLPLVRVDALLVEQALSNLLENALQHTPEGTVVRVRAEQKMAEVVVSVEDFGPGLDGGEYEALFAKFQRGAEAGGRSGVGLGLAICRAIIALHGGRAWGEPMSSGGSAFRFSLPVETPPPPPPVESTAA